MGFMVWGPAKDAILKGLEAFCLDMVPKDLAPVGTDTFLCLDGHGVPCPYGSSFFLVNNNAPSP